MHYRVSQGIFLTCCIISGATIFLPIALLGYLSLAFFVFPTFNHELVEQRFNIAYFQTVIHDSKNISIKYEGHEYEDVSKDFSTFYADMHDESHQLVEIKTFVVDVAVVVNDGRFSFAAHYSFSKAHFRLIYLNNAHGDMEKEFSYPILASGYYSFDSSTLVSLLDYL